MGRIGPATTNAATVDFLATFSQPVTGFTVEDLTLSPAATVTISSNDAGDVYTITVTGLSVDGPVSIAVNPGAARNANGQENAGSNTSTVTSDTTAPTATISLEPGQASGSPIVFTIVFDEPVIDFDADDVTVAGTANPTAFTLTGSGSTYTVTVTETTASGTVTVTIADGAVTDDLGNASIATSTADTDGSSPDPVEGGGGSSPDSVESADVTAPVIQVPGTVEANTDPGEAFATVSYTVTATDPASGITATSARRAVPSVVAASMSATIEPVCVPGAGTRFKIGSTTVTCTATDPSGNTGVATFDIIVTDNEAPKVLNAREQTVTLTASGRANYAVPTVSDNSGAATVACSPAPGSVLPVGNNTITCTVTDAGGNAATAEFTLTVRATPIVMGELPTTGGAPPWKAATLALLLGLLLLGVAAMGRRQRIDAAPVRHR